MFRPKIVNHVNVIGAGFAGIECALFLAERGVRVHVFSVQKHYTCDSASCAGCCKNDSWCKRLREEVKLLGSHLVDEENRLLSSCDACAAAKIIEFGLKKLKNHPNIDYFDLNITEINPKEVNIIATGPQTSSGLYEWLKNEFGSVRCFNQYPIYPLVCDVEEGKCHRHGGDKRLYIPLNYQEYIAFCNRIITERNMYADLVGFKPCEYDTFCVERLVEKNKDALKNAFMQPIFLEGLKEKPYAVIKLSPTKGGYILDGFCSNLPIDYQARIIRSLPQLSLCTLLRAGKPMPNVYINAPMVINKYGQTEKKDNIFFAGNVSGVFGHDEAIYSGLYVGHNVYCYLKGRRMQEMPEEAGISLIMQKLLSQNVVKFVPIVASCDIIELSQTKEILEKLKKYEEDFNGRDV